MYETEVGTLIFESEEELRKHVAQEDVEEQRFKNKWRGRIASARQKSLTDTQNKEHTTTDQR